MEAGAITSQPAPVASWLSQISGPDEKGSGALEDSFHCQALETNQWPLICFVVFFTSTSSNVIVCF